MSISWLSLIVNFRHFRLLKYREWFHYLILKYLIIIIYLAIYNYFVTFQKFINYFECVAIFNGYKLGRHRENKVENHCTIS